jgi:hypothetical protein
VLSEGELHFEFHVDPSHGWLECKRSLLERYGLVDEISEYSYVRNRSVFLEEDCDALKLITLLVEQRVRFSVENRYYRGNAPMRSYERYSVEQQYRQPLRRAA